MTLLNYLYRILRKIAEALGFNLVITRMGKKQSMYEAVSPSATYAPWLSDREFIDTYAIIENSTLVDKYRCYELWQLVQESSKLKGAILEVGVWRGGSGALIACRAKNTEIKDPVYLCDTFQGVVKAGDKDSKYVGGEHSDTSSERVYKLVHQLKLDNVKILKGVFPDETAFSITDPVFRLCHIDVDVYQSAKDIVDWIWPKLVPGGMVIFDDFGFPECKGITDYANELRSNKDVIVIHNLNGHAILLKIS